MLVLSVELRERAPPVCLKGCDPSTQADEQYPLEESSVAISVPALLMNLFLYIVQLGKPKPVSLCILARPTGNATSVESTLGF